jgi:hypothetical protein
MFSGMTVRTENFDVAGLKPEFWVRRIRFYMMAMQIFCLAAFRAVTALFHYFLAQCGDGVGTFGNAAFPVRVFVATPHCASASALYGTVSARASASLASGKRFTAELAAIVDYHLWLSRLNFFRASLGATVSLPAVMRLENLKGLLANRAFERYFRAGSHMRPSIAHLGATPA